MAFISGGVVKSEEGDFVVVRTRLSAVSEKVSVAVVESVCKIELTFDNIVDAETSGEGKCISDGTKLNDVSEVVFIAMVESVGQMEFISNDVVEAGTEAGDCFPDGTKLAALSEIVSMGMVETNVKMEFVSENVIGERSGGRKSVSDATKFSSWLKNVVVPVVESDGGMESVSKSVIGGVTEEDTVVVDGTELGAVLVNSPLSLFETVSDTDSFSDDVVSADDAVSEGIEDCKCWEDIVDVGNGSWNSVLIPVDVVPSEDRIVVCTSRVVSSVIVDRVGDEKGRCDTSDNVDEDVNSSAGVGDIPDVWVDNVDVSCSDVEFQIAIKKFLVTCLAPVDESDVFDEVCFRVSNIGNGVVLFVDGILYVDNLPLGNGLLW